MSIAEKLQASKDALDALLTYANDATSAGDTDLGEAIRTLVDGYGKGGSGGNTNGLVFEQSVYRETEGHTITVPLPDGFDLDALLEKNVAIAIYDDGTTPMSGTRNSQIMTVWGFVPKDIFGWSDWESNTRHPVQKAQFQGTDGGQLANWTNNAVYSGLSHQTAKVTTNKFYNAEMYGGLNFTRNAGTTSQFNIYWGRGNSSYGFMPRHTYIIKLYAFD